MGSFSIWHFAILLGATVVPLGVGIVIGVLIGRRSRS